MVNIIQIHSDKTDEYLFMENLLIMSFPKEEYRDIETLRYFTKCHHCFKNHIISDDSRYIGLITLWEFNDFIYIEHFAIDKIYRNHGYGSKVISLVKKMYSKPIVLEVEPICDETTRKRVEFYKKMGFECFEQKYLQPPYYKGDLSFPLVLMAYNLVRSDDMFERVKATLYSNVYLI